MDKQKENLLKSFAKEADFRDRFLEHLSIKFQHWLLDNKDYDNVSIVKNFISWVENDVYRDLVDKRGGYNGISFSEARKLLVDTNRKYKK